MDWRVSLPWRKIESRLLFPAVKGSLLCVLWWCFSLPPFPLSFGSSVCLEQWPSCLACPLPNKVDGWLCFINYRKDDGQGISNLFGSRFLPHQSWIVRVSCFCLWNRSEEEVETNAALVSHFSFLGEVKPGLWNILDLPLLSACYLLVSADIAWGNA